MSLTIQSTAHLLTNEELLRGNPERLLFNVVTQTKPPRNPNIASIMREINLIGTSTNKQDFEKYALYVSGYLACAHELLLITTSEFQELRSIKYAIQDAMVEKFNNVEVKS